MNNSSNKFHLCPRGSFWTSFQVGDLLWKHWSRKNWSRKTWSSLWFSQGNTFVGQSCFLALGYLGVLPLPVSTYILTCWFPFQSTQSLMKAALELSGISCVGSAVNMIRLNASALGRGKSWVTPSRAAGTRRMYVTPAWFTQVSVEWKTSGCLRVFWDHEWNRLNT